MDTYKKEQIYSQVENATVIFLPPLSVGHLSQQLWATEHNAVSTALELNISAVQETANNCWHGDSHVLFKVPADVTSIFPAAGARIRMW